MNHSFSFCFFRYVLVIKDWFYRDRTFWVSNFWIPVVIENATFRCRNMSKKREIARDQRRTADVVNEKATTAERREKERRSRPQRTMCVGRRCWRWGRTERRQVLLPGPCCYPVTVHRAEFATRVFGWLRWIMYV